MAEQLLNGAEVGAPLEQVRGERVPEEVGMDAPRLEAGRLREPAQDQEGPRAGEGATPGVQEELRPVAAVEIRPPPSEVPAERFDRRPPDRHDALLRPLPLHPDEPVVQVDAALLLPDGLGHAQAAAVKELD
jgi:hypothetical protein